MLRAVSPMEGSRTSVDSREGAPDGNFCFAFTLLLKLSHICRFWGVSATRTLTKHPQWNSTRTNIKAYCHLAFWKRYCRATQAAHGSINARVHARLAPWVTPIAPRGSIKQASASQTRNKTNNSSEKKTNYRKFSWKCRLIYLNLNFILLFIYLKISTLRKMSWHFFH